MNTANYITVTEFKNMNPEVDFSPYTDVTLSGMISRASQNIDNYLQYSLGIEQISNEKAESMITNQGNLVVYTRKFPIQSVSAIQLKLGTVNLNLNMTDSNGNARYDIPSRGRYVMYPYQEISMTGVFSIRNFYQLRGIELFSVISYVAGYSTIPNDLKDAVNLWAKDIFIRQVNPMEVKSTAQGAVSVTYNDRDAVSGDSNYVKQAKSILQSYRKFTG